jgi:hypothetical protein
VGFRRAAGGSADSGGVERRVATGGLDGVGAPGEGDVAATGGLGAGAATALGGGGVPFPALLLLLIGGGLGGLCGFFGAAAVGGLN